MGHEHRHACGAVEGAEMHYWPGTDSVIGWVAQDNQKGQRRPLRMGGRGVRSK